MRRDKMRLLGSLIAGPTVQHHGMWRHPDTDNGFLGAAYYENLARLFEHGRFDGVFLPDAQFLPATFGGDYRRALAMGGSMTMLDPLLLMAVMARVTRHLGLGATVSATHVPTYHIARTLGSLDLLSGGRIAWNVVTSGSLDEAANFGADTLLGRTERYDRADEVLEACMRLWASWDADAIAMDRASGVFARSDAVHRADYEGRWIRSKGPLTVPPSPQGRPVIMQAGASGRGRDFAARWAEMIFSVQNGTAGMKAYYDDVKGRMEAFGRRPEACAIFASVDVIVGETEAIAREKRDYLNALVSEDDGLMAMSFHFGFDVSRLPLDEPLADIEMDAGSRGMLELVLAGSRDEKLTLREAARLYAIVPFSPQVVGTPLQVADELQHYFEAGCCDGFIVKPTTSPGTFEQMVRMVVPELQRRGLFRTEYRHRTLRETVLSGE